MNPGVNVMISYKLGGVGMFLVVLSCKISVVFLKEKNQHSWHHANDGSDPQGFV